MSWSEAQTYCRSRYTDLSSIKTQEDNDQISSLLQTITVSVAGTEGGTGGGTEGETGGGTEGETGGGTEGEIEGETEGGTGGGTEGETGGGTEGETEGETEGGTGGGTEGETEEETEGGTGGGTVTGGEVAWIGLHRHFWVWSDQSDAPFRLWASKQPTGEEAACVMMDSSSSSAVWYRRPCDENHPFLCHTAVRPTVLRSVKVRLSAGSADLHDPTLQDSILQQLKQKLEERGIREEVKLRWRRQPDGSVFHREEETAPPGHCEEGGVCVTV
ncbi:uncharacterized protein [Trachinotus anak]|uniref:uncharacterized protein n=1 Tax=Trachinotus anak TaxID=443729 RepID=UPI0039F22AB4